TDALQQFHGRVHALGQEKIGPSVAIVNSDFPGEQNSGSLRRDCLDGVDELASIHPGHDQIGEHQIHATLFEALQSLFAAAAGDHAIAASFKHDLADGKGLFVIVHTKNGSFRLHSCFRDDSLNL